MKIYRKEDLAENLLTGKSVAVLGYGNQGHAHALNLRDEGVDVLVGCRKGGKGWERSLRDGFSPTTISAAAREADFVVLLLPDEVQEEVYREEIKGSLKSDSTLIFAHGFTVAFKEIEVPKERDVVLVAPKGQGHYLRKFYREHKGLPCLVAVEQNFSGQAMEKALSYASSIGCLEAGAISTTFREEAVTDLFGEQAVLCGGVPELVKAAFEVLVENGYSPEVAYIECMHELKIITDLMHEGGLAYMRELISATAAYGSFASGKKVISDSVKKELKKVLANIEKGSFARSWIKEAREDPQALRKLIEAEAKHSIEIAGERVRALMPGMSNKRK